VNARCYVAIDEQALYLKQEAGSARIQLCEHGNLGGDHEESVRSPRPQRLHTIFERHFGVFCAQYDEKYAATYGRYRLEGIQQIGERFCTCGDYLQLFENGP
jgi:hypothetical protein